MISNVVRGLTSGAVGTVALNLITYLDMAVRGRPASNVPAEDLQRLADVAGVELSEEGRDSPEAESRRQAGGALLGYVTGLGVGALYGALRPRLRRVPLPVAASALTVAAMGGSDVPSTILGVTNPREWSASGWAADIVPHLGYGIATALTYEALEGTRPR